MGPSARNYLLERLHCLDDFFPQQEKRTNLSEFIIVDVILNRCLVRVPADVEGGGIICNGGDYDPDAVRYAPAAYCKDDLLQAINRTTRTHCSVLIHVLLTTRIAKEMLI